MLFTFLVFYSFLVTPNKKTNVHIFILIMCIQTTTNTVYRAAVITPVKCASITGIRNTTTVKLFLVRTVVRPFLASTLALKETCG